MNICIKNKNKAFTLIELLVVVAIISLLSSVVFSSLKDARLKSRDAQRKMEFNQVEKALYFYFDKYGHYPLNMNGTQSPYYDNFNNMAQLLVNEGFLSKIPVSPCGSSCSYVDGGYAYFAYNAPSVYDGAFIITELQTTPYTPSCKPALLSGAFCYTNWPVAYYCVCLPNK